MSTFQKLTRKTVARATRSDERRRACRYSVAQDDAWLGWWKGGSFQSTAAKIVDISLRGAFLRVADWPPTSQPVLFRLPEHISSTDWAACKVVGTRKSFFGPREVRISFKKVFTYEVFKTLIQGPDFAREIASPQWLPEEAEERDWW